jgi:hypothetical protein
VGNEISEFEKKFIREASQYLENPSFLMKLVEILGDPLERGLRVLPEKVQNLAATATDKALKVALRAALFKLDSERPIVIRSLQDALGEIESTKNLSKVTTSLTGVAGGFFGMAGLPVELPITTTLILRSIAQIGASFGVDLNKPENQIDCLFVLSAGTDYYSARFSFSLLLKEALRLLTTKGTRNLAEALMQGSAPILVRLISHIASRFHLVVGQKWMAQSVPIVGAAAGGMINFAFTEHFNAVAKYHFGLKSLEARYGEKTVRDIYASSSAQRA